MSDKWPHEIATEWSASQQARITELESERDELKKRNGDLLRAKHSLEDDNDNLRSVNVDCMKGWEGHIDASKAEIGKLREALRLANDDRTWLLEWAQSESSISHIAAQPVANRIKEAAALLDKK